MWIKYNGKRINLSNKDIQLEHTILQKFLSSSYDDFLTLQMFLLILVQFDVDCPLIYQLFELIVVR